MPASNAKRNAKERTRRWKNVEARRRYDREWKLRQFLKDPEKRRAYQRELYRRKTERLKAHPVAPENYLEEELIELQSIIKKYSCPEPNSGCWLWERGTTGDGYGELSWKGKQHRAHRLSYVAFKGPIPKGLCALHHCDTPLCTNPNHLWTDTNKANTKDCVRKGRHARGETQGSSKLTKADIESILAMRHLNNSLLLEIANKFGVTFGHVGVICQGLRWKHVTKEWSNKHHVESR